MKFEWQAPASSSSSSRKLSDPPTSEADFQAMDRINATLEITAHRVATTRQTIESRKTLIESLRKELSECRDLYKKLVLLEETVKVQEEQRVKERVDKNINTTTLRPDAPDFVSTKPPEDNDDEKSQSSSRKNSNKGDENAVPEYTVEKLRERAKVLSALPSVEASNPIAAYVNFFKQKLSVDPDFEFRSIDEPSSWHCLTSVCGVLLGEGDGKKKKNAKEEASRKALYTLSQNPNLLYTLMDLAPVTASA